MRWCAPARSTGRWPSAAAARSSTSRRRRRWPYSNCYGLAKAGVNSLTQQLAIELGGQNIRINAIAPGPINTEANRTTTPQEMVADIVKGIPLSRMGEVDDLVGMCLFLLSDQAKWITGQIFNVDGGQDLPISACAKSIGTGLMSDLKVGYVGLGNQGAPIRKTARHVAGRTSSSSMRSEAMTPLAELGAELTDDVVPRPT